MTTRLHGPALRYHKIAINVSQIIGLSFFKGTFNIMMTHPLLTAWFRFAVTI